MVKKILKSMTSMLIVLTMIMGQVVFIFTNAITYAADATGAITTNNKNVEFSAVVQKEDGREAREMEVATNEDNLKLHMQVTVKEEGYFTGTIVLDTANFRLKTDILSEGITKIEGNTITLSQINAGETRDIFVGIEIIREEVFDLSLLNMESQIHINGIYRDSSEKDIQIEGTREIKLTYISPYHQDNNGNILKQEMITNKVITENGINKRIIQMEVESGLEGNLYPIQEEKMEIEIPKVEEKLPERVEVHTMKELVTNGKTLQENDWEYQAEEGKVVIDIKNEANQNKVIWKNNGTNKILITYIYDTEMEVESQEVGLHSEKILYDPNHTVITGDFQQTMIQEELDNIIRLEVQNRENDIYKGKIQEGIEREFTEEIGVQITAKEITNTIQIEEDNSELHLQNVYARKTVLNKEEINTILGETGTILIYNADTLETIATIQQNTKTDENGNILSAEEAEAMESTETEKTSNYIVITYPENIARVGLQIENPQNAGSFKIENTKVITGNTKENVQSVENMNYIVGGKYFIGEQENMIQSKMATIQLINTETVAKLEVNKTELSTMTENTGVEIRVVLQSNHEKYDLYKNPTISIQLPNVVQGISVNSVNLLYAEDEFQIVNPEFSQEKRIIRMTLEGEQKEYEEEAVEGPTIIINANLTLDKKAPNSTEKILLQYSNEKATTYEMGAQTGEKTVDIPVKSYTGLITVTDIPEYGINAVNNQGTKSGKIELGSEAKSATFEGEIINNHETPITDVKIMGTYPTKEANEGNNIDAQVGEISGVDLSKAKVYYTDNQQATDDIGDTNNGWTEQFTNPSDVKKYLIQIDTLDIKEEINYQYMMEIPENLEYNYTAKQGYEVNYLDINSMEQTINQKMKLC